MPRPVRRSKVSLVPIAERAVPRLLWITDRTQCPDGDVLRVARAFLSAATEHGDRAGVLLREKDLDGGALLQHARALREVTRGYAATLLVSARADVAIAAEADGVHLPQDDLPAEVARSLLGTRLLGVSCHSPREVDDAVDGGADYVTFGPVYDTASKRTYGPPVGVEALAAVCAACSVPVLALGGITMANGPAALAAGAHGLAFISAVATAADPAAAAAGFTALLASSAVG